MALLFPGACSIRRAEVTRPGLLRGSLDIPKVDRNFVRNYKCFCRPRILLHTHMSINNEQPGTPDHSDIQSQRADELSDDALETIAGGAAASIAASASRGIKPGGFLNVPTQDLTPG